MTEVRAELRRLPRGDVTITRVVVGRGSRVRLRPLEGREVRDPALAGRIGIVETVEADLEGNVLLAVALEDDPGRDLGGVRPGRRFFFAPGELEPLPAVRILVAGIGNVFLGDDGFGCCVAARLVDEAGLPPEAAVVDFGVRRLDLAYELADYDAVVLVDAMPFDEPPGTIRLIEPALGGGAAAETHGMNPVEVLQLSRALDTLPERLFVVGCRPERIVDVDAGDERDGELSAPVAAAVPEATRLVRRLVAELIADGARPSVE